MQRKVLSLIRGRTDRFSLNNGTTSQNTSVVTRLHNQKEHFILYTMTLTFELDLGKVQVNRHADIKL